MFVVLRKTVEVEIRIALVSSHSGNDVITLISTKMETKSIQICEVYTILKCFDENTYSSVS